MQISSRPKRETLLGSAKNNNIKAYAKRTSHEMPKAHGKSGKAFWAPLKTAIKAYAKQTSHEKPKAHGKSEKTF
jgi:hypothetical protein